jgi:aspartate oxidase
VKSIDNIRTIEEIVNWMIRNGVTLDNAEQAYMHLGRKIPIRCGYVLCEQDEHTGRYSAEIG